MDLGVVLDDLRAQTTDIFGCMESAEDEIRRAMKRHPQHADLLFGSFLTLRPRFAFCSDKLYRVHCAELLERVAHSEDVTLPTRAEMLELLQRCTAFIPFHSHAGALYRRLFEEAFPGDYAHAADGVETLNERFPGETDGLRQELVEQLLKVTAGRESAQEDKRWRGDDVQSPVVVQMGLFAD